MMQVRSGQWPRRHKSDPMISLYDADQQGYNFQASKHSKAFKDLDIVQ